jgi:DNA helicase HerA-like ATPase
MSEEDFKTAIIEGYTFKKDSIIIGAAMLDGEPVEGLQVKIPLRSMNRHGLIAGATGTGKTKTLQIIAEQLSMKGVPCLLMDLKGDLSGLAQPGKLNEHITWRHQMIADPYEAKGSPIEFLSLSNEPGVKLRATVSEFGPVLLSKILELNDTQQGVIALVFKYSDDNNLPLLNLKDLKKLLQFLINEGKAEIVAEYGAISSASVATIMRKIIELEQQGAENFFGELSFDVQDLVRTDKDGNGVLSILRLTDIQDKPKLFSTFMLSLLAEVYSTFPEEGDADKPKLCIFIDEAHLIFDNASKALLDQIEAIVKLIRSKAVGIYFVTQNPTDLPEAVLSQLGLKVQHALRAFTAKDRKNIKQTAENYPLTDFYKTDEVLTSMGIGQALVTALNEKGIPTPLAATLLRAPASRMDILEQKEISAVINSSQLVKKYDQVIDSKSAYELLTKRLEKAGDKDHPKEMKSQRSKASKEVKESSTFENMSKNTMVRQMGNTLLREVTRALLRMLGVKR